jgi:phenylacetate-coenzyme A ligase PaaK-like adenylate-forming protein
MGFELPKAKSLEEKVFNLSNEKEFTEIAFQIFHYQYFTNPVYKAYCDAIKRPVADITKMEQVPFLPIQFFQDFEIKSDAFEAEVIFKSSGTTGPATSSHFVKDVSVYEKSFAKCFAQFYGDVRTCCILGLLPSYLERGASSLVYMVNSLIKKGNHPLSGFYLYEHQKLRDTLATLEAEGQKTILFGVTFALLDFAEAFSMPLVHTTIIETGGMKGRKKELTKAELYAQLQAAFSLKEIHSEYGMTELLSQAYAINGLYRTPPWMKVFLRDETDPFSQATISGGINVIDLANIHSCSFIQTDDIGRSHADGSFEVLGRMDNSDVRGCSQLTI